MKQLLYASEPGAQQRLARRIPCSLGVRLGRRWLWFVDEPALWWRPATVALDSPGEFVMGSPESEAEREDDETQHRVILSQGFWLADTACTASPMAGGAGRDPESFSWGGPASRIGQLGRCAALPYPVKRSSARTGAQTADRSRVGICLPGWHHDPVLVWRADHARAGQLRWQLSVCQRQKRLVQARNGARESTAV